MRRLTERPHSERGASAAEHFAVLGATYDRSAFGEAGTRWVSDRELRIVSSAISHLPEGAKVLDAGAGNGRFSQLLAERHRLHVTALDLVPEMLQTVHARVPSAQTVLARLGEPLPLRTQSFDAVVSIRVLKWVPAWQDAMHDLARVLKPGGTIVVEITNRHSLARFGYIGAPIGLCTIAEMRAIGRQVGIDWTAASAGTHLPHPVWSRARSNLAVRVCSSIQVGLDALLRTAGARSIFLAGTKQLDDGGRARGIMPTSKRAVS